MKISFQPIYFNTATYFDPINPAKSKIPDWYKSMPMFVNNEKKRGLHVNNSISTNATLKSCSPFLDALTAGYIYELPADIEIRKTKDNFLHIRWRVIEDIVTLHTEEQHPNLPLPQNGTNESVFKWYNPFNIKTPKGYSCLFTHPLNRHDLPFRTFSGIVDTDDYTNCVQFPFQVLDFKEEFIILEKGTPVAQIIPFKRDDWDSDKLPYDEIVAKRYGFELFSKIKRSYRNQWWKKKTFN